MATHDENKMISYLTEKWGVIDCPMCRKGPLQIQDKVFQLNEYHQGNLVVGGPLVPVIPVTCINCGYTLLVNALISKSIDLAVASEAVPETKTQEQKA